MTASGCYSELHMTAVFDGSRCWLRMYNHYSGVHPSCRNIANLLIRQLHASSSYTQNPEIWFLVQRPSWGRRPFPCMLWQPSKISCQPRNLHTCRATTCLNFKHKDQTNHHFDRPTFDKPHLQKRKTLKPVDST